MWDAGGLLFARLVWMALYSESDMVSTWPVNERVLDDSGAPRALVGELTDAEGRRRGGDGRGYQHGVNWEEVKPADSLLPIYWSAT